MFHKQNDRITALKITAISLVAIILTVPMFLIDTRRKFTKL